MREAVELSLEARSVHGRSERQDPVVSDFTVAAAKVRPMPMRRVVDGWKQRI
jgi:hypothetical protein